MIYLITNSFSSLKIVSSVKLSPLSNGHNKQLNSEINNEPDNNISKVLLFGSPTPNKSNEYLLFLKQLTKLS